MTPNIPKFEKKELPIFTCLIDDIVKLGPVTVITLMGYNEESFAPDSTNIKRITLGSKDMASFYNDLSQAWNGNERFANISINGQKLRLSCSGDAGDIFSRQKDWLQIIKLHF
jgi:hypothetical protein